MQSHPLHRTCFAQYEHLISWATCMLLCELKKQISVTVFHQAKQMWSWNKTILPPSFYLTEGKGGLVLGFGSAALLHTFAIH